MNLYKIIFSHYSPKDSEHGIKCLLLAENSDQVYEWIASKPVIEDNTLDNDWAEKSKYKYDFKEDAFLDSNRNKTDYYWTDDNGTVENYKERMIRLEGEIYDPSVDFEYSYYGITLLGWELLKEDIETNYSELQELKIVYSVIKN